MPQRSYKLDLIVDEHGAVDTLRRVQQAEDQVTVSAQKASAAIDQQAARFSSTGAEARKLAREHQQLAEAAAAEEKWKKAQANMAGWTNEAQKTTRGVKELQAEFGMLENFVMGLGSALTGGAILYGLTRFVGNVIETRRETANLSRDLGISTDAVQVLQYAARDSSVSLATMTTAIDMMDSKIGRGDAGLTASLAKLGLDFETVRHKSKELAFEDITAALAATEDRFKRVGYEAEIFGTQKIDGIVSHYQELKRAAIDANAVLDPDQIAALQHVGKEWEHLKIKVEGVAASMVANIERAAMKMAQSFQRLFNMVPGGVPNVGSPAESLPTTPDPSVKAQHGVNPLNPDRAAEYQVLIGYERELEMAVRERIRLENEAAEARRNFLKITLDINKEYDAEIKKHDDIIMRMQVESAAAEFKARQSVMANKGFDAAGNALPGSGPLDQMQQAQIEYERKLAALRAQAANYQQATGQPMDTSFREQQLFNEFQAAFQKAATAATEMATAHTAAAAAGATAATGLSYLVPSADAVAKAFASFGGLQGGTINYGQPGWFGWSPAGGYQPPKPRAMGGPVEAGRPYVVGEKRPELFVPESSGRIEPSAGGGRGAIHIAIDARGAHLEDDRALDRLVNKVVARIGEKAGGSF